MHKDYTLALAWFRRDLRASDQAALYQALKAARHVRCAFVFARWLPQLAIADHGRAREATPRRYAVVKAG